MLALARIATEYSKIILLLLLLITLGFASQLRHLQIDDDILNMIPTDHPARLLQENIEQQFGLRDLVILAVENPQGAFNVESLARIKSLSDYLQSLPEIIAEDVTSLATTDNIVAHNDDLLIRPPLSKLPHNDTQAKAVFQEIKDNPLFLNRLVSADAKVIAIFAPLAKNTTRRSVYEQVSQHLAQLAPAKNGDQILVSGNVMIEGALGFSMRSDLRRLGPVIIVVLLLLLSIYFKHFKLALLPILTGIISVIWTMGLLSILQIPVYLPTTLIPVMLLVIGITDEVHLIAVYKNLGLNEDRHKSIFNALKKIIRPIGLTSMTTGVGFVALSFSPILPLKHFGLFTAFGIMVAYFLTFSLTPAFLALMHRPKAWAHSNALQKKSLIIWLWLSQLSAKNISISLIFISFTIAWGASGIRVDENWVNRFKSGTILYESDARLNQSLGGTSMLYGYIVSDQGTLKKPFVLQGIEQLQQAISQLDNIGVTSQ
ncbi:efflux RND transporter permease subunit [sulfur-oxidizing endosymbiont of Gigantopelta aegis]|uniref:efflux RND transporter permease subunit n=1 Tax=sulfur-oxidizing endosymbiont of Gigantopelta aegis TaxID=2794934 RepID=UPI0018DB7694|nr:MMPL family transporter [sulfur-oxidizing endosymbiont of Gigantopelta aegis]